MKSDRSVAIIGGGYSGTILAAQLARRGVPSIVIDGSGRMGRGVAYSTTDAAHVLNVRAEGMSAWAGEPDHFAEAFAAEGGDRRGFAQRRQFGDYLGRILDEAIGTGLTVPLKASAIDAQRAGHGWKITLDSGEAIEAGALVLAAGNQAPEPLSAFTDAGSRFIANPWGHEAQAAVGDLAASGEAALLIGTGLTMVDLVLSLDAAGHRGKIVALSRRGLIPRAHADFDPAPVQRENVPQGRLSALFRWARQRSARVGWRAAIDSLRPHTQAVWKSLDASQQRRFLRHARPWWDVHRHRIAPEVAGLIARLVAEGRLEIVAGRIIKARPMDDRLKVQYRSRRASRMQGAPFAYAFNCTGPLHSIARSRDPLLRGLLDRGEVQVDQLGIGLDVDDRSLAAKKLWALGPLTKGKYWEIVAVPDIREQAARVAADIERELA